MGASQGAITNEYILRLCERTAFFHTDCSITLATKLTESCPVRHEEEYSDVNKYKTNVRDIAHSMDFVLPINIAPCPAESPLVTKVDKLMAACSCIRLGLRFVSKKECLKLFVPVNMVLGDLTVQFCKCTNLLLF